MKCRLYKCHGSCCYNVPLLDGFVELHKDKIVTPVIRYTKIDDHVIPITSEEGMLKNKCPFLRDDYKCNIYESRPEICRLMGTIPQMPCLYLKK